MGIAENFNSEMKGFDIFTVYSIDKFQQPIWGSPVKESTEKRHVSCSKSCGFFDNGAKKLEFSSGSKKKKNPPRSFVLSQRVRKNGSNLKFEKLETKIE